MIPPLAHHYDALNARRLVRAAADAYRADNGLDVVIYNPATDTRAVVTSEGRDVIVAFRGTQSLENFVTDLECRRIACGQNGEEIHAGFAQALDSVWAPLRDALCTALASTSSEKKRLWLTGHSLGGALATLAAWRLEALETVAGVYTFGAPRCGNAAFRDLYDNRLREVTFRVVDAADFITRLPWLLGLYRHCGTEVFYDCFHCYHIDCPWWLKAPSDLFGSWREYHAEQRLALLQDHHVSLYTQLLQPAYE